MNSVQTVVDAATQIVTTVVLVVGIVWRVVRKNVNKIVEDGLKPIQDELQTVSQRIDKHEGETSRELRRMNAIMNRRGQRN